MQAFSKRRIYEFCFLTKDYTLVQVEESADEVTIRATADTFNDEQKRRFIREIAAEGFIPEAYRWHTLAGSEPYSRGVRWIIDNRWLDYDQAIVEGTQKWIRRLLLPTALFWGIGMYLLSPASGSLPPPVGSTTVLATAVSVH